MDSLILTGEGFFFFVVKLGLLLFLFVYLIFAAIVIKQARMMTETLEVGFETQIKFLVVLHFIVALFSFLVSIFIL